MASQKFTAKMLMVAMGKHSKIKTWDKYAEAISAEAVAQGCDPIDEKTLPRRLGQVVNSAKPFKAPAHPARPKTAPKKPPTIAELAAELGWKA
jgi:hypothetical protein